MSQPVFNILNLDFGHMTDEELGINTQIKRDMIERPKAHIARIAQSNMTRTRNGNVVRRMAR